MFNKLIHLSLFKKGLDYLTTDFFNLLCQFGFINYMYVQWYHSAQYKLKVETYSMLQS